MFHFELKSEKSEIQFPLFFPASKFQETSDIYVTYK